MSAWAPPVDHDKQFIEILSEQVMSYAFKNKAILEQLLSAAEDLKEDFRKFRLALEASEDYHEDFLDRLGSIQGNAIVNILIDDYRDYFGRNDALSHCRPWLNKVDKHLRALYALSNDCASGEWDKVSLLHRLAQTLSQIMS